MRRFAGDGASSPLVGTRRSATTAMTAASARIAAQIAMELCKAA
ncbi:MAG TPA: hypothetical protein VGP07_16355 [Polyangia bacterium]|jgi:hypothetical protein